MALRFATWLIRLRWWIVIGWVAGAVGLAVFTPKGDPAANELLTFLPDDAPSVRAAETMKKHFPTSAGLSQAVIVAERTDSPGSGAASPPADSAPADALTDADLAALNRLAAKLRGPLPEDVKRNVPGGELSVRSPGDFLGVPDKYNPLIAVGRGAAIVVVEIPSNFITIRSARVVDHIRELIEREQAKLPPGLALAVTGSAAFGHDYAAASERSHRRTLWVTIVAVLAILLVIFRAPLAAGVLVVTVSLAAIIAHLVLAIAMHMGLHVGTAEKIFVFVLLYGVGVDYSLLYLARFREFLSEGLAAPQAAATAWTATAPAIGASAGTDIAGLAMLSFAAFRIFQTTGQVVPIALFIALAASLTLVPAAAAIFGGRLFWPGSQMGVGGEKLWPGVARVVTRRPAAVLIITILILAIPAIWGARLSYVYDALTGLDDDYGAVRGVEMARRHWPVGQTYPAAILLEKTSPEATPWSEADEIRRLTERLAGVDGVKDVRSLTQPWGVKGKGFFAGLRRKAKEPLMGVLAGLALEEVEKKARLEYVSDRVARLTVIMDSPGFSNEAMDTLGRIKAACTEAVGDSVRVSYTGATAEMADVREVTQRDFRLIAPLALGVVFVIVLILLRDAILSAFMVAATVLSYLATLGVTHVVFVGLAGAAGLDWKVQVFLFVVLVAVGQDYNIFLAARLAEESRRSDVRTAARIAIIKTGPIISSAGIIMAATLGSLMAGDISLLVQLGFAFALGMLLDTFIVRPLLLPAFAVLTGRTERSITPA